MRVMWARRTAPSALLLQPDAACLAATFDFTLYAQNIRALE